MQTQSEVPGFQEPAETLRSFGLKVTPQRTAVFEAISGLTTHPSAEEVYRRVSERYPNISFDTVNRTLLTFADISLVEIIDTPEGIRRFDTQTRPHHHLYCTGCGQIIDFDSAEYDRLTIPEEMKRKYLASRLRVSLRGICPECRKNRRTKPGGRQPSENK